MPVIVAANGAAVKYNSGDVSVSYAVDGTKISGVDKKSEPIIYIPITNPTNTDWPIDNVKVDFAGGADGGSSTGTITDMWVYFGNTKVYHAGVSWTNTTTFTTPIPGDFKTADNPSTEYATSSSADVRRQLYTPINHYQTRIIQLYGDSGIPDYPLICRLHVADMLGSEFRGIGVRGLADEVDRAVPYDALSYTWGNGETTQVIQCNGIDFPITENLFHALRALRASQDQGQDRYLWVDAICINQIDNKDKAMQVRNMFQIFKRATKVIAWLGKTFEGFESVCNEASALEKTLDSGESLSALEPESNFWDVYNGMFQLYTRPWFKRIWIQQEIFAAEDLRLQCALLQSKKLEKLEAKVPPDIAAKVEAISTLHELHIVHINCFERYSSEKTPQPDFVEALLYTGALEATNPRDYIYGILGITNFPSKAMSLQDWMGARHEETFIPIDYSLDLSSLLSIVTWALLMEGGLGILARFKAFADEPDDTVEKALPSWVIDWRLASRLFTRIKGTYTPPFGDPSPFIRASPSGGHRNIQSMDLLRNRPPQVHQQFCDNNRQPHIPLTKLIVRGMVEPMFYAKGTSIWKKKSIWNDEEAWQLDLEVYSTDLIVYVVSFVGVGFQGSHVKEVLETGGLHRHGGLWVLRPAGADEFRLIACLQWHTNWPDKGHIPYAYKEWEWAPKPGTFARPLSIVPVTSFPLSLPKEDYEESQIHSFTSKALGAAVCRVEDNIRSNNVEFHGKKVLCLPRNAK
ncbi:hypothetical protein CHU98_g6105 [Xylaria longipes]|nr:hypothetical protein CHU98_g6105 [Xylaria longipes]